MDNGPFIDDLPFSNGDFPFRYVNVYQRVGFPSHRGTPIHHPTMKDGDFSMEINHPASWGIPHFLEIPRMVPPSYVNVGL